VPPETVNVSGTGLPLLLLTVLLSLLLTNLRSHSGAVAMGVESGDRSHSYRRPLG